MYERPRQNRSQVANCESEMELPALLKWSQSQLFTPEEMANMNMITRLGCGGSNTNKTVCNSLLKLTTLSAQLGFNSWGFNNSIHLYLQNKSIHPQPVLMKWDIAVGEAAFYEVHRLTRFHKRGPFDMTHIIV
ncbi:hypothetical protein CAPTEDRAFT_213722 [Capitella teleta]|uniref:Uncharacterized protein n=1 Tax=Capitella teleta TaxID=283909 RepID=R7TG38_CAPTE|nr:hypothetical protein CAPTEDRAFT_213722 [Capitella teleta]|eukprot:ELT92748.1 hypothetical protein CAPTEDRAFT_213722 [Capitella teleta]